MTRNTSVTRIDPNRLADSAVERTACMIDSERALAINRAGWDRVAPIFHGGTALPEYGPLAPTEDTLRLLELTPDLRALELGYGSGHSLRYLAERGGCELWGLQTARNARRRQMPDNAKCHRARDAEER